MNRETLPKRLRFEIFKRDGFCCTYCGATPMQAALHIDHVIAVANGGTNDPQNLVTSCADCNLGKGAVPLERKQHTRLKVTTADYDHAEQVREWLNIQKEVAHAKDKTFELLVGEWERRCGTDAKDLRSRLPKMLEEFGYQRVLEAFEIVGSKKSLSCYSNQLRYLYGIFRRWRGEVTAKDAHVAPPAVAAKDAHVASPVASPQPPPVPMATTPWLDQQASTKPLSRRAQRCLRAVTRVLEDIKTRPEAYPSKEAREDAVYNAFVRAAWASTPIRPLSFYRDRDGTGFTTTSERGVTLVVYTDDSLSIEDDDGFNPYEYAYIELSHLAATVSAPYLVEHDTHEEHAANKDRLWRRQCELEMWLTLLSEQEPGALDYYRNAPPYCEILAEWDTES